MAIRAVACGLCRDGDHNRVYSNAAPQRAGAGRVVVIEHAPGTAHPTPMVQPDKPAGPRGSGRHTHYGPARDLHQGRTQCRARTDGYQGVVAPHKKTQSEVTPKSQSRPTRWAVIVKGGGRVVVEAETAEAAQAKVERRGYFVLEVNLDASNQAVSF